MSQLYDEALAFVMEKFQGFLIEYFRELLEKKHLYQSTALDWSPISEEVLPKARSLVPRHEIAKIEAQVNYFIKAPWRIEPSRDRRPMSSLPGKCLFELWATIPTVKLFCKQCDRLEPFNPLYAEDAIDWTMEGPNYLAKTENVAQVLVLSYLCQSCKEQPEIFLVHRFKNKITLAGRSIIEAVSVPKHIPKNQVKYYSGSIVAFQSGQTLAALFLLRTLIEQVAQKTVSNKATTAEEAIDAYMATLPDDFKQRFPSIRDIYSDLSAAIHAAEESTELYNCSREKIDLHFRAKELYDVVVKKA